MSVMRVSFTALQKILTGQLKEKATCVIKFYSTECKYCHALKEYYEDIAEQYGDIYFFAFNTDEDGWESMMPPINGVPTIALVKYNGYNKPQLHLIDEPHQPNEYTWYRTKDIVNFIERYKNG